MHLKKQQANPDLQEDEFELKDTNPQLGGRGWMNRERYTTSRYDLVEQMFYLYVRIVKAKILATTTITCPEPCCVEVKLLNYVGKTRYAEDQEWNQVLAFSRDAIKSSILEVFVKGRKEDYLGKMVFDLNEIPTRIPPDSPLAPQWYNLNDLYGKPNGSIIMLAVWMGTQADDVFSEAWHSDAAFVSGEGVVNVRSKVYVSPKLWYLRVNIIEVQDIIGNGRDRDHQLRVKGQVRNQVQRTTISRAGQNPQMWKEDLVFVAAEPFEEELVITIEYQNEELGTIALPLSTFERRIDHRPVQSHWFNLMKLGCESSEPCMKKEPAFSGKVHLKICLEGGYHVLDESRMYMSDQRPTARQLWNPPVGILEVGILGAHKLFPMKTKDGRGRTDAYCVARYGQKWVRTRTILDTFDPIWNEQYTWEVYDPCTVITLGVFDNHHLSGSGKTTAALRDLEIGKVRIRLSALESHKIYSHSYPLVVLQPTGVKKMGEVHLAVRFRSLSLANMVSVYGHPLLPKMHYLHPLTVNQQEILRCHAMSIVASRLGRAEPPLRKEVVECMLDFRSSLWSMRRSKTAFLRIMSLVSGILSLNKWFRDVCHWKNTVTTTLVHILFLILVWCPELILPTFFIYMFFIGLWNYRSRPRHPPHMDTRLSCPETMSPDELEEEFDTVPTTSEQEKVRVRYDRIRHLGCRVQGMAGDIATQGERIQSVLSWRDPRATSMFIVFCLLAAAVLYAIPFKAIALVYGLYILRHPRFRSNLPGVASNFFERLPARTDCLM
ncbi:unnamed protein product [Cuscuta campestris]|uniref:C2 domain-containing protein n=1 Tax=Cuscuta campestris TaxID=132261 RepID=A0A484LHS9_9ASTE|nr:unnamed protein product [Cuscuta campestris]